MEKLGVIVYTRCHTITIHTVQQPHILKNMFPWDLCTQLFCFLFQAPQKTSLYSAGQIFIFNIGLSKTFD